MQRFCFRRSQVRDYAHRFAKVVSGQNISFGKMEKQITCDIMSSKPQNSALEQSIGTDFGAKDSSSDLISSNYSEGTNENVGPTELVISSKKTEDNNKKVGHKKLVKTNGSVSGSKSSKQLPKVVTKEKKQEGKQLRQRFQNCMFQDHANRLKVREKAMLTGVLSKYAATSSALQEQS